MYSQDKIDIALQVYHQCGYVTNTIRMLGYPTRRALYTWIENEGVQKPPRKALDNTNTAAHPRNPPIEVNMDAFHRCFELGESIKCVSEEIGYSRASIFDTSGSLISCACFAYALAANRSDSAFLDNSV